METCVDRNSRLEKRRILDSTISDFHGLVFHIIGNRWWSYRLYFWYVDLYIFLSFTSNFIFNSVTSFSKVYYHHYAYSCNNFTLLVRNLWTYNFLFSIFMFWVERPTIQTYQFFGAPKSVTRTTVVETVVGGLPASWALVQHFHVSSDDRNIFQ